MKKSVTWLFILNLIATLTLGMTCECDGIEFSDGKFKLQGFLKNETGMRLKDHIWQDSILSGIGIPLENAKAEKNQLSVMRSTLQLEGEYDIIKPLKFGFIFRGYYDAKWDLDHSIDYAIESNERDLRAEPKGEYLEADVDLREWYFIWDISNFRVKVGCQQIVWGEADAIRISDIINPLDYSKDYTTTAYGLDWEDVRIPQRMIDIVYVVPDSEHQFKIEVVLNPEDTRVHTYAPYGELYYGKPGDSSLISTQGILAGLGVPPGVVALATPRSLNAAFSSSIDDALPENNSSSFSGGMRFRAILNGWDLHLFYYYQRAQNPVFTSSGNFSLPPLPWDVFNEDLGIKTHFPHINTIGGTFNYFHDTSGFVFRGELGYTVDHPYTGMRQGNFAPGLGWGGWFYSDVVYKDTLTYMIGFDRPTWIYFLNDINTFFITGQFVHKIVLDYDDTVAGEDNKLLLDTVMGKDGSSDHQVLVSLKIDTKYFDDTIKPDMLCVWDINGHNGYIKPSIRWEPTYDWRIELGALYLWAEDYSCGPFGPVKDDDQLYMLIEYRF